MQLFRRRLSKNLISTFTKYKKLILYNFLNLKEILNRMKALYNNYNVIK